MAQVERHPVAADGAVIGQTPTSQVAGIVDTVLPRLSAARDECAKRKGVGVTNIANPFACLGAVGRNRTGDLLITNQLLYQLSYNSVSKRRTLYLWARRPGNAEHCPMGFESERGV